MKQSEKLVNLVIDYVVGKFVDEVGGKVGSIFEKVKLEKSIENEIKEKLSVVIVSGIKNSLEGAKKEFELN